MTFQYGSGFPYATCFVCGQQGHLSRDCEKNANGIYPDGGGCNVCGSTKHLKRDCPELAAQKQQKNERSKWLLFKDFSHGTCVYVGLVSSWVEDLLTGCYTASNCWVVIVAYEGFFKAEVFKENQFCFT
ncbi:zinc knuckle [Oesophagostomum dentatum]|uniref:Zinc knuckle n=1 Tax=Oesophagostomum dentatum TaxID=61180 RepID=A0A0B1SQH1_OESDE|nr:zinc knuckle [Oesophagostomum dentatum]